MRKILSVVLAGILVTVFCSLALAEEKKESMTGKGMVQRQDMMAGEGMMMCKGKMKEMCPMHGMMMKQMMEREVIATGDGGVLVLLGNKIIKYDKDLNLIKEAEIKLDMEGMQKMMMQMQEKCPMSQQQGGMMGRMQDNQVKLKCAEEWLKKAIELHELHMRDPKSTTEASQMELMDQIKKAYECVTGAAVSLGSGIKEPEKQTETKTSSQHEAHH